MSTTARCTDLRPDDIAVVGMAGRFPGAPTVDAFWSLIAEGRSGLSEFQLDEMLRCGVSNVACSRPDYVAVRGVLNDAEMFDAGFFGFSAIDADLLDPQHRVILECAWDALENSGHDPRSLASGAGVFVGGSLSTYYLNEIGRRPDLVERFGQAAVFHANATDHLATRIAYKLNLRGPAITVQTACSTSLVAVHIACQSLRDRECDVALAGGVSVRVPQQSGYTYREGGIESIDGRCRPFDADASGTVFSNGAGIVVLKRLSDALDDRDVVRAIVRGTAVNNDGAGKVAFTAPSVDGQAAVIAEALAVADVAPSSIQLVQAHGTGTRIGDPIEMEAIRRTYGTGRDPDDPLVVSAVKANVGHTDAAAGVVGLIATVLALEHEMVPPHPSFTTLNPLIDDDGALLVPTRPVAWPRHHNVRRAGVSAFGVGGTNAHVILEEAPVAESYERDPLPELMHDLILPLSARTPAALEQMTDRLADWLERGVATTRDAAFTLRHGRTTFAYRRAVVGSDPLELSGKLRRRGREVVDGVASGAAPTVAFVFAGQGIPLQSISALYAAAPAFRSAVDECAALVDPHLDTDVRAILSDVDALAAGLPTSLLQPAMFVVEYSLARALIARGLAPGVVCGHSLGEYAAACIAGVFSLSDAVSLIVARGRLMEALPPGAMVAVAAERRQVAELLSPGVEIAAINGPRSCVVSGDPLAVADFEDVLARAGLHWSRLPVHRAFHSRAVEAIRDDFAEELSLVEFGLADLPFVSNLTGEYVDPVTLATSEYWLGQVRQPVRFHECIETIDANAKALFVQCGPGTEMAQMIKASRLDTRLPVLSPQGTDDVGAFESVIAQAWASGVDVRVGSGDVDSTGRRTALPSYPFERTRHWVDGPTGRSDPEPSGNESAGPASPVSAPRVDLPLRRLGWRRAPVRIDPDAPRNERLNWLVFDDPTGSAGPVADALAALGQIVTVVRPGTSYGRVERGLFEIDPTSVADYERLLGELRSLVRTPSVVLHCWQAGPPAEDGRDPLDLGFFSITRLARAVASQRLLHPIRMAVVTSGAVGILGGDLVAPERAASLGAALVLPEEQPNLSIVTVDVPISSFRPNDPHLQQLIWESLEQPDTLVALRNRERWVREEFDERVAPTVAENEPAGVHVITGGLGGIGLSLAKDLARALPNGGHHAIALISRHGELDPSDARGAPDETLRRRASALEELRGFGARLLVLRADVTDSDQLAAAFDRVRAELGPIEVVVHAAGVPGLGTVERRSDEEMRSVLAPKVEGALNVMRNLQPSEGRMVVFCSSLASLHGVFGQADYAAANAFLDALAVSCDLDDRRVLSVSFDTWKECGMAVDAEAVSGFEDLRELALGDGIRTVDGVAALRRCLTLPGGHVAVRRAAPATERFAVPVDASRSPTSTIRHPRPELAVPYRPPRNPPEERLVEIWEEYLGVTPVGIDDSFLELGGQSLLAAEIVARIRVVFELDLPLAALFERDTIEELALEIEELIVAEMEGDA